MMLHSRTALFLSVLVPLAVLSSCGSSDAAPVPEPVIAPARAAIVLQPRAIVSGIELPGDLQAFQRVDLFAKVNSFVREVRVDVGTQVKAGEVLATLEAPELGAQLSAAGARLQAREAQYAATKATYDRLEETSRTPGTVAPNDLDLAKAAMEAAKAQLAAARGDQGNVSAQRDYLTIRAPFAGIVTLRNVNAGAYVGPGTAALFNVQEQQHLRLVVAVPEANVSGLHMGDSVRFTVRTLPGRVFQARVARLSGALDDRLRAQRTEMDVDNRDGVLLPGMVAQVQLPMRSGADAFVVPAKSVLRSTLGSFVIRSKGGKAQRVPIRTGLINAEDVQVFGELHTGDTLLLRVSDEIVDGAVLGSVVVE